MVDYSAFAPARPPQSPTHPAASFQPSALAPQFAHLEIDHSRQNPYQQPNYHQPYPAHPREQQYPTTGQRVPPLQLPSLSIPSSASHGQGLRSPTSPGGFGYSGQNRPRPNLVGGPASTPSPGRDGRGGGPTSSVPGGPSPTPGDSPNRIPRKSSLAAKPGMSPSPSVDRLPPLPTSSSSMHFPHTFGSNAHLDDEAANASQRDSSGGEAVFNGAELANGSNARSFTSPPPQHSDRLPTSPPPASGPPPASASGSNKKANPLEDLIATETLYVEDLGVVIKRVAAAWSRSNFPPPALDSMFRAVEAVYRINKTLLAKLLDIGPNPSSPKALGDLLMRWISDIEPAYSRYGSTLSVDFDTYAPVQSNSKLGPILSGLAWPNSLPSPDQYPRTDPQVTLDRLFELPVHRIRYYKKLYAKLLRSTQEGRSDHALLVSANEKLAKLEQLAEEGRKRGVLGDGQATGGGEHVRSQVGEEQQPPKPMPPRLDLRGVQAQATIGAERSSTESGRLESPSSGSLRSSSATGTSTANTSSNGRSEPPVRVEELERRLNTTGTLDIFSMQPRKCKLQMQPPSLTFTRRLRKAASVTIAFTPASDPSRRQVVHSNAYVILLTDLFLVCEWNPTGETSTAGQDLNLLYPPLAGKHLRASGPSNGNELDVSIMGKENLTIRFAGGEAEAREWKAALEDAARFGATYTQSLRADSGSSAQPRSPMSPPLNGSPSMNGPLSPTLGGGQASRAFTRSPEPTSPVSSYSRQDSYNTLAAPQAFPLPPQSNPHPELSHPSGLTPFGVEHAPSVPRPDRNASIARNQSPGGFVSSPSSSNFPIDNASNGSRGASPLRADFQSYPDGPRGYGTGRQSPHYAHTPNSDFGSSRPAYGSANEGANSSSRPSSRQSQNSFGSSSNRTDRSSGYPEPPPPLPKERSYNGLNISGRGGPIYPTSMRTDPGDSRSVSGQSDFLSPHNSVHRSRSAEALRIEPPQHYRMPSQALSEDRLSGSNPAFAPSVGSRIGGEDDSPPASPVKSTGPQKTSVVADMRCKIFLQQYHSVWKSLGTAKLKLYLSMPSNTKQLVVDSDKGKGKTLISTIVLTDGVERVGKTGVAIELSDQGDRTGIIYMLQMKTEQSATGLFEQLLVGSDRAINK
ncbi:hypothetical protein JCM10212_003502 [Sporobolomyces blumeae]